MSSTKPWKRFGGAAGLVASGLIAGGVLAGTFTASAAEDTPATGNDSSVSQSAEEPLTGDVKTQVEEAVLAEYPGATIERTETDAGGGYESHIVTADGERLTVLVDEDFAVTGTETGGRDGRGPGGGDCPEDDAAAGTTEETTTPDPGTSESPTTEAPDSTDGSAS
jgi:hypothetical protein